MIPRSENRVLAVNEINAHQSSYVNKYGDTIDYTYHGIGVFKGRFFSRCTVKARTGNLVKFLKSMKAAENFINRQRKETTFFCEVL